MTSRYQPKVYIPSRDHIEPAFGERNVPMFFGCDDKFLPHAMTAIASVMDHASQRNNYDIFIIQTGISMERIAISQEWMRQFPNARLRFIDIDELLEDAGRNNFKSTRRYSHAVYFRLFAPRIFSSYDRIIYLDSDMVIMADMAEYYGTDLGGKVLAGTHDFVSERESLVNPANNHFWRTQLGKEPGSGYFVSCALLMDLKRMRDEGVQEELLEKVRTIQDAKLPDQDVLNAVLNDRVKFVDVAWNYFDWMLDPDEESLKFTMIDDVARQTIRRSRNRYKILHFGDRKPWNYDYDGKNEEHYWKYLQQTPFHREVVRRLDAECASALAIFRYLFASAQILHFRARSLFFHDKRKYSERIHNIDQVRKCAVKHLQRKELIKKLRLF